MTVTIPIGVAPALAPAVSQVPLGGVIAAPELSAVLCALLVGALVGSFVALLRDCIVANRRSRPRSRKTSFGPEQLPVPRAA